MRSKQKLEQEMKVGEIDLKWFMIYRKYNTLSYVFYIYHPHLQLLSSPDYKHKVKAYVGLKLLERWLRNI